MQDPTRRDFLATTAAAGAASLVAPMGFAGYVRADSLGKDMINIAVIGCGGRGSGAANDNLTANKNTRIVALCDLNTEGAKSLRAGLIEAHGADRVAVPDDRIFGGIDGYQKVMDLKDVDLVILATAP